MSQFRKGVNHFPTRKPELSAPQSILIAGPNGSGKSTCAKLLLPSTITFINADMIAQELTGHSGTAADLRAGRILLNRLSKLEADHKDFALETTLATVMLASRIKRLKQKGYEVHLIFLWLPSDELAVERVATRIRAGGHPVPVTTIKRRFVSGVKNFFEIYRPIVNSWRIYDNSKISEPELIAHGSTNQTHTVHQSCLWNKIERKTVS